MAGTALNILMIEDTEADFLLVERFLKQQLPPFRSRRVTSNPELEAALAEESWDIVLSDYSVPGMDFHSNLNLIHERLPNLPVILVSGSLGEEQAVTLIKQGVWDFVLKDNLLRLAPAIERELREAAEHRVRTEAQTALREAEAALRTLVNANPESAVLIDTTGTILAANETIARRLGTAPKSMIGAQLHDLLPAEIAETRKQYFAESVRTGKPLRFEDVRSGRHEDNYVHPIKDEQGNVTRLAILGVDVTERKETEVRLKEQAALLDIAQDAILVKDMENNILYWNKGAERLYGWSADETSGRDSSDLLFAEKFASEAKEARMETLVKGAWHGDLHQKAKDARELIVEGRWTLVRDEQGKPKAILSVNSDVTAQRSTQAQLLRAQRLESLGTLAGGIAHDLNNVLSPILMGVEGLSFHNPNASSKKIIEIIKTSAQRGADIVRQILNFARGMEGTHGEVQLKHVVREIEGIIRETFVRSIVLKSEIPRDLWTITGDTTQLHQVLMNLCVNARDAMPDGGGLTLSASNVQLDEAYAQMNIEAKPIRYIVLKVEDTGTGMPPGVLEKIFDPFFTTKDPGKGTGLGLSTVRSIVKNHGGFINVYSEPGKGTSFKVYLPAAEQGVQAREETVREGVPMGEGELILLVEDELSLRDITRQILESYGYQVLTAADGTEALAQYLERKGEIRLVLTDMMMPYMDGAATIRAIRKINPTACIIATSGLMVSEYAKETMDLGAQGFLAKPYTAETLLQTLQRVLEGSSTEAKEGR
jgi:PAS domain S-box-containing protein